jgi:hypothetical protein
VHMKGPVDGHILVHAHSTGRGRTSRSLGPSSVKRFDPVAVFVGMLRRGTRTQRDSLDCLPRNRSRLVGHNLNFDGK